MFIKCLLNRQLIVVYIKMLYLEITKHKLFNIK